MVLRFNTIGFFFLWSSNNLLWFSDVDPSANLQYLKNKILYIKKGPKQRGNFNGDLHHVLNLSGGRTLNNSSDKCIK